MTEKQTYYAFPGEFIPAILEGWMDCSSDNDSCPRSDLYYWTEDDRCYHITVWVEKANPAMREDPTPFRVTVEKSDEEFILQDTTPERLEEINTYGGYDPGHPCQTEAELAEYLQWVYQQLEQLKY